MKNSLERRSSYIPCAITWPNHITDPLMKQNFELRETLPLVNKPGRYLGHEYNSIIKDWEATALRCALIFPDLYEIGMSHQGLQILYHILNGQEQMLAERCYCPAQDMEELLRTRDLPLCSLESNRPLQDFDLIAITLPYELCYTNILTILDLAGIPLRACNRADDMPIVLGGGSCSLNPEPVADFFDAILLGDGEEAIVEIGDCIRRSRQEKLSRTALLDRLAAIPGVYIPAHYSPSYNEDGTLAAIVPMRADAPKITRRVVSDLSQIDHLLHPLVPNSKIVHDRLGVEIARGCTRGCRFCQAGIIYRPVRERTPEQILKLSQEGIKNSGFNEIALLSLSTGDYSCLETSLPQLMDRFADEAISVSMPSMRVGTLTQKLMDQIKRVRKTGFTLAPEAGSERLRRVINKGITEEDLLDTSNNAFGLGWKVMKLYFMIGLPTETDEDIEAIAELAKKTKLVGSQAGGRGRQQINVSVGTFVPKPHTPFQWEAQISMDESRDKISHLKKILPRKGINLKWHDPEQSLLEGVFSRGDRRLADLLETVWKKGARLDAWSDFFDLNRWQEAAAECSLVLDDFLRKRDLAEVLPWQHLSSGIDEAFLKEELAKAHSETYTPDCRYHACQKCGLCDFKTIKPVVIEKKKHDEGPDDSLTHPETTSQSVGKVVEEHHFYYTVTYSREGAICYLGHLEILQIVFRILRRARIRTNFSKGFNPSPKVSFSPALPVGTQSNAEFFIMDLPSTLNNLEETKVHLNRQMPPGLAVQDISLSNGKVPQELVSSYRIDLHPPLSDSDPDLIKKFLDGQSFQLQRVRKGKAKDIDFRPLVLNLTVIDPGTLSMELISKASQPGVKPLEAIAAILSRKQDDLLSSVVLKTGWKRL